MKKLLILGMVLGLVSCEKDANCECDAKVIIVDGDLGQIGKYTVVGVPSDCEGGVDRDILNLPSDHWYIGTENCD